MIKIDNWILKLRLGLAKTLLVGWLDTNSSPEGWARISLTNLAHRLYYWSPEELINDLKSLQESPAIIAELDAGKDMANLRMLLPEGKYGKPEPDPHTQDLLPADAGTVYEEILAYWNEQALAHPRRLVATRGAWLSAPQRKLLERAWRNEEFRINWRRSIRAVIISGYNDANRINLSLWAGQTRDKLQLWALASLYSFDRQAPQITDAQHLILYPEPSAWRAVMNREGLDHVEWARITRAQRETCYRRLESALPTRSL